MRGPAKRIQLKKDRRKAERIRIPLRVKYRWLKGERTLPKECVCEDISGLGIRLSLHEPLIVNAIVEIFIILDKDPQPLNALCRVRWCKKLTENKFVAGLKFIKIKEYFRFIEFFCEKLLDLCSKEM